LAVVVRSVERQTGHTFGGATSLRAARSGLMLRAPTANPDAIGSSRLLLMFRVVEEARDTVVRSRSLEERDEDDGAGNEADRRGDSK